MTRKFICGFILSFAFLCGAMVFAQGEQTGSLTGRVVSSDGLSLPGAAVTIKSAALQGVRSTDTDINGVYLFRGLPPGDYTVTFEMQGMATLEQAVIVPLGGRAAVDVTMTLAKVQQTVEVTAPMPPGFTVVQSAVNYRSREVNALPTGRTPFTIAELAPGLTDNTPNASQVKIAGMFAYDNVWLINGVDVNDNVLGTANNLFIEEAVGEAQVLTSGISPEYGRFSGGVVNVVTKTGGDTFSGSFRTNLSNPSWSVKTPFETSRCTTTRPCKLSTVYEAVLGGPVVRTQLWFFGAGRLEDSSTAGTYQQTGIPYTSTQKNRRYEAKLTGTIKPNHTLQGSFIDNQTDLAQPSLPFSIDPATYSHPSTPNRLFVASYNGVIGSKLFATAQYSQKTWGLRNQGGTSTQIVDSPFLTRGVLGVPASLEYNAPYFDSSDPEDRNNRQVTGSVAYFASSPRFGTHDVKAGVEQFTSTRVGGNSQSSTGYVFQTDYKVGADGRPLLDADGHLIPRFVPGTSRVQQWMPLRGATIDIRTRSFYVRDKWVANPHWTFDLGLRYEHVKSEATGGISAVKTGTLVPRLGASYDVKGNGRTVLQAFYGEYSGKYSDVEFARNTNVGNADRFAAAYTGPAGEGRGFAPGFDLANYPTVISGTFPTANYFFADGLSSPLTREFTLAAAQEIGQHAYAKVTYVWRKMHNFVEDFITIDGGKTIIIRNGVNFGTFDNVVYRNSDVPKRDYQALALQGNYRVRPNWTVNGHWTIQLRNNGNFEGEGPSTPAIPGLIGDYPEILVEDRDFPTGRLSDFQRNKVRLWTICNLSFGRFGAIDIAPLYRYNSALTYSLVANGVPLSAIQLSRNPGYARLPGGGSQSLFFGERGSQQFKGYHLVDLAFTYAVPVWSSLKPWLKVEVLNVFNNQTQIGWDTTVLADNAGPKDANGLPLNYTQGPRFGQATKNTDFPRPRPGLDGGRTFLMGFGVRF